MLSLKRCRKLLPTENSNSSDTEVEAVRDALYSLANSLLGGVDPNLARRTLRNDEIPPCQAEEPSSHHTSQPPTEEEQYNFDERAAIFEFDGGMSRTDAERAAFIELIEWRKQRRQNN